MLLRFTKMQGLGNDFVVLDATAAPLHLTPGQIRWIADRHFGVGCDQILIVEPPHDPANDFRYRILNADGSEVENCGNGARCFVRFVHDRGLTRKDEIRVETLGGLITPRLNPDGRVTVNMGEPEFEPARVPFLAPARALTYPLTVGTVTREFSVLSMGNPHAVQVVPSVAQAPVTQEGPLIERHPAFPKRVNAGFMEIVSRTHIRLRVFERGAGETLACGTGACAAVAAGIARGLLDDTVTVTTRGGDLSITWAGPGNPVWMTGDAVPVFSGELHLPDSIKETA
ncbi:MAG: diaminopimelate epimerase [Betaproteobacteria bacterium]|nr:diaminopimelate epimerase [Betaproteobacteria bacterium]